MKKKYFAQTHDCNPLSHKAKYFNTEEEGRHWLFQQHGGGTLKIRTKRGWKIIANIQPVGGNHA